MGMTINEARRQIPAAQIQRLLPKVIITNPSNPATTDGDIARLNLTGKDIDNSGVSQNQVCRRIPFSY